MMKIFYRVSVLILEEEMKIYLKSLGGKMSVERSKQFLVKALQELPNKQEFSETRSYLNRSLRSIELNENKKQKKAKNLDLHSQWMFDMEQGSLTNPSINFNSAISNIDKMIDEVEKQIKE